MQKLKKSLGEEFKKLTEKKNELIKGIGLIIN